MSVEIYVRKELTKVEGNSDSGSDLMNAEWKLLITQVYQ